MSQTWIATTTPGYEDILYAEVRQLGGRRVEQQAGAVQFEATRTKAQYIVTHLRTATRLYLRLADFAIRKKTDLYSKVQRINWLNFIGKDHLIENFSYVKQNHLHFPQGFVRYTIGTAIWAAFEEAHEEPPKGDVFETSDPKDQDNLPRKQLHLQRLVVRIDNDRCIINLDASGFPLYQRLWRVNHGGAPIRESIAACMLKAMKWQPDEYLIDPMCGSGTIPIEAWTMAQGLPPGFFRAFGLEQWRSHNRDSFPSRRQLFMSEAPRQPVTTQFQGFDMNAQVISIARENVGNIVERLEKIEDPEFLEHGLTVDSPLYQEALERRDQILRDLNEGQLSLTIQEVSELKRPDVERGLILTNAPYGVRLTPSDSKSIARTIRDLVEIFCEDFSGWRLGLLTHRDYAPPAPPERCRIVLDFRNGGIPVRLWEIQ